jgi:hypothetical protein
VPLQKPQLRARVQSERKFRSQDARKVVQPVEISSASNPIYRKRRKEFEKCRVATAIISTLSFVDSRLE